VLHICFEDQTLSQRMIDICTSGVHQLGYDTFKAHLEVLNALFNLPDTFQGWRIDVGMNKFLKAVNANLKFKNETYQCIKFLIDINNPMVFDWLFKNKDQWIEIWLIASHFDLVCLEFLTSFSLSLSSPFSFACFFTNFLLPLLCAKVRETTASLINLVVGNVSRAGDNEDVPLENMMDEEVSPKVHEMYKYLLTLFLNCRLYAKVEVERGKSTIDLDIGHWRLVTFFKLLRSFAFSVEEKKLVCSDILFFSLSFVFLFLV
jgi:hypothetical protein